jgi:hypothetical protein
MTQGMDMECNKTRKYLLTLTTWLEFDEIAAVDFM